MTALQSLKRVDNTLADPDRQRSSDRLLLEQFVAHRDEAAFAIVMKRHGSRVLGVCRRILQHRQDAEDVFQATFLILARKAGTVRWHTSVGNWLHEVACRLAREARSRRAEQSARQKQAAEQTARLKQRQADLAELAALLDEELLHLPARQRQVLMLCYHAGQTREETAQQLGWSVRSVERRLQQGRERLRQRLSRHGVTVSAVLLATRLASPAAGEIIPPRLTSATAQLACTHAGTPGVSKAVAALVATGMKMEGGMGRLLILLASLALGLVTAGTMTWATMVANPTRKADTPPRNSISTSATPETSEERPDQGNAKEGVKVRQDRLGDLLPPGALARLGTVRFRHGGLVPTVAYSPDGKLLASGGYDGFVRLWHSTTGKPIAQWEGHQGGVRCLAFSPDGKTLATCGSDKIVCLWNMRLVQEGPKPYKLGAHVGDAQSLAFSPDGKRLASGGWDRSVRVWDVVRKKQLYRLAGANIGNVRAVAFSPDGKILASAHINSKPSPHAGAIELWDPATGRHLRRLGPPLVGRDIYRLAFSPDGTRLAAAADKKSRVLDVATGKDLSREWESYGEAYGVAFSPDGKTLACGASGPLRLLKADTGKEILTFEGGRRYSYTVTFSPDGKTVAASGTRSVTLWDLKGQLRQHWVGHPGEVGVLEFGPDGSVITGGYGQKLHQWAVPGGKHLGTLKGEKTWNSSAALSPDGNILALPGHNLKIRLLDVSTGKQLRALQTPLSGNLAWVSASMSVIFANNGKTLISAAATRADGAIRFWDVATGKQTRHFKGKKPGPRSLALSPDEHTLVAGYHNGSVLFWDMKRCVVVRKLALPGGPILLAFSPDGRVLAIANGRTISLMEATTGQHIRRWKAHDEKICTLTFSPTGHTLVSAAEKNRKVCLWEVTTGQLRYGFAGHAGPVKVVAFNPKGNILATGAEDTTALLWAWNRLPLRGFRPRKNLTTQQLEKCWFDLAGNADVAYLALTRMLHAPQQVIPFLRQCLHPVKTRRLGDLIDQLDSDQFAVRERASKELALLGKEAEPALRQALKKTSSVETRVRIRRLLAKMKKGKSGNLSLSRQVRAVELLERLNTPESQKVLERLARGTPDVPLTVEAKAALRRLALGQGEREVSVP